MSIGETIVYDIGQHVVEISPEGLIMLLHKPVEQASLPQGIQLEREEGYKLCLVLHTFFMGVCEEQSEGRATNKGEGRGKPCN